jgi:acetyl-CoA acetyltransferase
VTPDRATWINGISELTVEQLGECGDPITANATAIAAAADDAGIARSEIGAVLTYDSLVAPDIVQANRVSEYLGLSPSFACTVGSVGASPALATTIASTLVRAGLVDNVAIAHSDFRSATRSSGLMTRMTNVVGNPEFESPFGPMMPTLYSFLADWLIASGDADERDLASIAVQTREWAALNRNARKRDPLTIRDVLEAPRVAGALGRYDCCLITDFGGALIVSRTPRKDRAGVAILGAGGAAWHEEMLQLDPTNPLGPVRNASEQVYAAAGVSPEQIDGAFLYDSFTVTVALQLIGYGLDRGRGLHALLSDVGVGPSGGFPVNTHGGLLSALTSGIFHIVEAVRQLRGDAGERQRLMRTVLVTNVGGVLSNHCALILGGSDA